MSEIIQSVEMLPLYPTIVYHGHMEGHDQYKLSFLSDEHINKHGFTHYDPDPTLTERQRKSLTGEYRGKIFLHHDPDFQAFFKEVISHVLIYLDAGLKVKTNLFDFYIMKSWYSIMEPTHDMGLHQHGSSDISFVYYPHVDENTYPIWFGSRNDVFLNKNPNELFSGMFSANVDGKNFLNGFNFLTSPTNSVSPDPGSILLFPSHLFHGVFSRADQYADKTRISIAGDIKLVLKPEITNYESGLLHFKHWRKFL